MTTEHARKPRNILKAILLPVLCAAIAYALVALSWNLGGSNKWKLASDEDGITIWTRKVPGDSLLRVKAQMRINARLASVVAILEETEILDKSIGIDKVDVLERTETPALTMVYQHYVHHMPLPIGPREFIIQTHHAQDPKTQRVEVNVLAAPNKLPPVSGLVRVNHLNNLWTLEPQPMGQVDLTMLVDVDLGGKLPAFVTNTVMPIGIRELFKSIRQLANQDRYRNAKVPHIVERDDTPAPVAAAGARAVP